MASSEDDSPITVFDLPQLYHKPSTSDILSLLQQLAIVPSSFSGEQADATLNIKEDGLTAYLTRIIASPLNWIASDTEKEKIWEAASQRLSERSGRMALASISRTFTICDFAVKQDGSAPRYINIVLNEPSLTDDNVGHKTWSGSFLLAKRLAHTMAKHFPALVSPPCASGPEATTTGQVETLGQANFLLPAYVPEPPRFPSPPPSATEPSSTAPGGDTLRAFPTISVLELGAGTGLAGIAAAALFTNVTVHLTDLPSIVPNLIANVESNSHLFPTPPTAAVLDWSAVSASNEMQKQYDCILAADSLYDPRHPDWLTDTVVLFLKKQESARVIVELPFREMDLPYHDLLRQEMARKGLALLEEGEDSGWDDWEGSWSEKRAVRCWWSVWGWADEELKAETYDEALNEKQQRATGDNKWP